MQEDHHPGSVSPPTQQSETERLTRGSDASTPGPVGRARHPSQARAVLPGGRPQAVRPRQRLLPRRCDGLARTLRRQRRGLIGFLKNRHAHIGSSMHVIGTTSVVLSEDRRRARSEAYCVTYQHLLPGGDDPFAGNGAGGARSWVTIACRYVDIFEHRPGAGSKIWRRTVAAARSRTKHENSADYVPLIPPGHNSGAIAPTSCSRHWTSCPYERLPPHASRDIQRTTARRGGRLTGQ